MCRETRAGATFCAGSFAAPSVTAGRLGLAQPFLTNVSEVVLERFRAVYRELSENHDFILRVVALEEERFSRTIDTGLPILESELERSAGILPGSSIFLLYDTYGFPPELTAEIAREHGLEADMEGFEREMEAQREQSRASQGFTGAMEMLTAYENLGIDPTHFVGYQLLGAGVQDCGAAGRRRGCGSRHPGPAG